MGEWDTAYSAVTGLAPGDDFLVRQLSATPPAAGTVRRITSSSLLGMTVWPSGDPTGVKDAAAINNAVTQMGTSSGRIVLMPGQWYIKPGTVSAIQLADTQTLVVDGQWGAVINAVSGAAGDMLRMYNPHAHTGGYSDGAFSLRSGLVGIILDGTSANAGTTGLHFGDCMQPQLNVVIRNFNGAGSVGLHLDNSVTWTEEGDIRAEVVNCGTNVLIEVTTGYNSFGYNNFDFTCMVYPGQDGVVIKNGPLLYSCNFRLRGNYGSSGSPQTSAVLRLTGAAPVGTPDAGTYCTLNYSRVDIQVEANGSSGANGPYSIYVDTSGAPNYPQMAHCYGVLNFNAAATPFRPSNVQVSAAYSQYQFGDFNGPVQGDTNLNPGSVFPGSTFTTAGPFVYSSQAVPVISGTAYPAFLAGDFFPLVLSGNTTMALNYSGGQQAGPQRKTIVISQPPSGGTYNYTVTWPSTGSPTLTSPTVIWQGLVTPVQSTGIGATDVYFLETSDGITWYGTARQGSSSLPLGASTAAGTAAAAPLTVPAGTLLTTAAAGAVENDGTAFYATNAASSRQVLDAEQFTCLSASYTLANSTAAQKLFNASVNGQITLAGSTTYAFECEFDITALSASAHTLSFGLGGTATFTSLKYAADSNTGAAGTLAAWQTIVVTSAAATALSASVTTTTFQARLRGVMRVNAAGTVIPQVTQGTNAAAAVVSANSWFRCWPLGSGSVAAVGDWS